MGTGRSGLPKGVRNTTTTVTNILGDKRMKPWTGSSDTVEIKSYIDGVNPHRDDHLHSNVPYSRYRENCQRCGPATDLRLAGYDVEATGKWMGDRHGVFSDSVSESYKHFYVGASWDKITASNSTLAETQIASLLPNVGARAIVRIRWNDGNGHEIGGHVFNIVRTKDGLLGVDGQVNKFSLCKTT